MAKTTFAFEQQSAFESKAGVAANMLRKMPVTGTLDVMQGDSTRYMYLCLGSSNHINGTVHHGEDVVASVGSFDVSRMYRSRGIGAKLLMSFVAQLKDMEVTDLYSDSVSSLAIATRMRVFGKDCLQFYDTDYPDYTELPLDCEQAIATNERLREARSTDTCLSGGGNLGVYVDLRNVDTSNWPRPILTVRK